MGSVDRPFAERLFTTVGGGFFHHHALGVRQAAHVALTRGMLVQEIYDDINCPTTVEVLREGGRRSEEIVEASLKVPIFIHFVRAAALDRLLPIVKGGRFILAVLCDDQSEATESVRKVRKASAG
ncbi:MAG: hypothetical protein HYY04_11590 [Chloroflexi bacterium]|nr:hypothetical protein [Chloroflexota bacterium]